MRRVGATRIHRRNTITISDAARRFTSQDQRKGSCRDPAPLLRESHPKAGCHRSSHANCAHKCGVGAALQQGQQVYRDVRSLSANVLCGCTFPARLLHPYAPGHTRVESLGLRRATAQPSFHIPNVRERDAEASSSSSHRERPGMVRSFTREHTRTKRLRGVTGVHRPAGTGARAICTSRPDRP